MIALIGSTNLKAMGYWRLYTTSPGGVFRRTTDSGNGQQALGGTAALRASSSRTVDRTVLRYAVNSGSFSASEKLMSATGGTVSSMAGSGGSPCENFSSGRLSDMRLRRGSTS